MPMESGIWPLFIKESFVVFVVCAIGLGSIVVLVLGTIYKILTGQKL